MGRIAEWLRIPAVSVSLLALSGGALIVGVGRLAIGSWFIPILLALGAILLGLIVFVVWAILARENERRLQAGIRGEPRDYERESAEAAGPQHTIEARFGRGLEHWQATPRARQLPWYLMIGAPSAGKTSALAESGLDVPAETARLLELGPTHKCAWWPSNQAIVIDTAGRYLRADESEERKEWRSLLRLIRRHGHRVPLQGVLVAVSLGSVLGRSEAEIEAQAHLLRRRLNEISTDLAIDVPVYVLVTQADMMEGLLETATALPQSRLDEAFGWTNSQRRFHNAGEAFERGFTPVIADLERLLPDLVMREQDPTRRRKIFLFPEELRIATTAVASFLRRAFGRSAYGEVPFLRGVYFTSAQQGGATLSPLLERIGHGIGQGWAHGAAPGGSLRRSLFLRDLFRGIIVNPEEQTLATPAREMPTVARRVVLLSGGLAALLVSGIFTNAFARGYAAIGALVADAASVRPGREQASLGQLDEMRREIEATEASIASSWRRLGLQGPIEETVTRAKALFAGQFNRTFESPAKIKLIDTTRAMDQSALDAVIELAKDVAWLSSRGASGVQPDLGRYLREAGGCRNCGAELPLLPGLYEAYVRWGDPVVLQRRLQEEQSKLQQVAPQWLQIQNVEDWCQSGTGSCEPIRFEAAALRLDNVRRCEVNGAYTKRVWDGLITVMVQAVRDSGTAPAGQVDEFLDRYRRRYEQEWREMILCVPDVEAREAAPEGSPYIAVFDALAENAAGIEQWGPQGPPGWFTLVQDLRRGQPVAPPPGAADDAGAAVPPAAGPAPYDEYVNALRAVSADVERARGQTDVALRMATDTTQGQGGSFRDALATIERLIPIDASTRDRDMREGLRKLLRLPVLNAFSETLHHALSELDRTWRAEIAEAYSGGTLTFDQLRQLYDPQSGALARLERGPLAPFFGNGQRRRVLVDRQLPLGQRFDRWVESAQGMRQLLFGQAERIVRVKGVPPTLNGPTGMFVTRQVLTLECLGGVQEFVYQGGVQSATFRWTPQCSDVSIRVWVRRTGTNEPERELRGTHEWRGLLGLNQFLRDGRAIAEDRLRWTLGYREDNAELIVTYVVEGAENIRPYRHVDPAASLRE
jgi:hypothetical protein